MKDVLTLAVGIAASLTSVGSAWGQETHLFWGDTHHHTNYSPDAYSLQTTTADPDTAYRFAKGLPVIADLSRARVQIDTPLDFLVITDHAEYMGVIPQVAAGNELLMSIPVAQKWKAWLDEGRGAEVFNDLLTTAIYDQETAALIDSEEVKATVWEAIVDAAERHNEPGHFTAFIGWEWSSMIEGRNLHRIVFTPDGKDTAMNFLPFSYLMNNKPQALWNWLAETAEANGTDFVAIPHNMNLSGGSMFPLSDEYGDPVDADYATTRMRWEPAAEVSQYKGDSETHATLSSNDPFADFETYEHLLDFTATEKPEPKPGDYARTALMRGLQLDATIGANPYKFGMIGASDTHTGFASVEESNFLGKYALDSIPENKTKTTTPGAVGWDAGAQGLAGVWATENTRQAIFEAFQRKEIYTSTGPRIALRVFGGYDFTQADVNALDLPAVGYAKGVPMGSDLAQPDGDQAPTLLIHAVRDPIVANLDRVQVVKGWLNPDGSVEERVYDAALSDGRLDGSIPVGNTVDLATASFTNDIGDPDLVTVWTDPNFDPTLRAFYYVRVLQIPTPRHSVYDAVALGIDPEETGHPAIIQDRAYSSPIWYTPAPEIRADVTPIELPEPLKTVEDILADGYAQMTGAGLQDLVGQSVTLQNLVTGQSFAGELTAEGERVIEEFEEGDTHSAHAAIHGGGPLLMGYAGYEIVGDTIHTSDGLNDVITTLYKSGDDILAVRNVDGGKVRFRVTIN
ncbi:MAG: DUF3604 domain-containing protein [Paracoccaceae bacterium]